MTIYRQDLERVYALIEKPEAWTQGACARDKHGVPVEVKSEAACSWCAIGAFMHFSLANDWEIPTRVLMGDEIADRILNDEISGGIASINDESANGHAEVLALLRQAIERAPVRTDRGEA